VSATRETVGATPQSEAKAMLLLRRRGESVEEILKQIRMSDAERENLLQLLPGSSYLFVSRMSWFRRAVEGEFLRIIEQEQQRELQKNRRSGRRNFSRTARQRRALRG
jgi:hypothetical protein